MDKNTLRDLETLVKKLRVAVVRSQGGIQGLLQIVKLGPSAAAASSPTILEELRQLEADMQRTLRTYRDALTKATQAVAPPENTERSSE